jgi:anionic cell wall polymer biosynthesis LytR-Cps2A-Psr (LCP) family protein
MVDQVQAVDNYSENPLLKGIEQDGKVSLNLKLKKGKVSFSGDTVVVYLREERQFIKIM